jgi:hypothetical protein
MHIQLVEAGTSLAHLHATCFWGNLWHCALILLRFRWQVFSSSPTYPQDYPPSLRENERMEAITHLVP